MGVKEIKDFLGDIIPTSGQLCLAYKSSDEQFSFRHSWANSLDDLATDAYVFLRDDKYFHGLYFAVNSFTKRSEQSPDGKVSTGRKKHLVQASRAVWVDLDCKGRPGEYKSKFEALAALTAAVQKGDLPMPSKIVDSGTGIHLYYCCDEEIDAGRWQNVADGFKQHLKNIGMQFDHACTADGARIMRLPGSLNKKEGRRLPVALKAATGRVYGWNDIPQAQVTNRLSAVAGRAARKPRNGINMLRACPILLNEARTGGAGTLEPLWAEIALLLTTAEHGRTIFHRLSNKHASYTPAGAEAKMDTAEQKRKTSAGLHATAKSLHAAAIAEGKPGCTACPHQPYCHTPADFGGRLTAEPPLPYSLTQFGAYVERDVEGEVSRIPITYSHFKDAVWYDDPETQAAMLSLQVANSNGSHRVHLDVGKLVNMSQQKTHEHLTSQLIMPLEGEAKTVGWMFEDWRRKLRAVTPAMPPASRIGWSDDATEFSLAERTLTTKGPREMLAPRQDSWTQRFVPQGSLQTWQTTAELVAQGSVEHQLLLATAFAGPLMRLLSQNGFLLSFRSSSSGTGKTTALKVASAAWHDPASFHSLNDTINAAHARIMRTGNIPQYWDEVKFTDDRQKRQWVEFIHGFVNGRQKQRMHADQSITEHQPTHSLLVLTTNSSIPALLEHNSSSPEALMARTLEFTMPVPSTAQNVRYDLAEDVERNYGHAGPAYMEHVLKHFDSVRKRLQKARQQADTQLDVIPPGDRRYYRNAMVALLVGAELAAEIGLVAFDVGAMRGAFIQTATQHYDTGREVAADLLITDWVAAVRTALVTVQPEWLVTDSNSRAVRGNSLRYEPLQGAPSVHVDLANKRVLIPVREMPRVLKAARIEAEPVLRRIPLRYKWQNSNTFAGGTRFKNRMRCYEFPFAALDLQDNVTGFVENAPTQGIGATHAIVTASYHT